MPDPQGASIDEAIESFIASRRNRGIQTSTLAKYMTFAKQLRAYCDGRGYLRLNQLTVTDMDRSDGKRSRAKKLERLKGFVRFCLKRKWLSKNITEDLESPVGSSIPANKTPFTDAEPTRIYAGVYPVCGRFRNTVDRVRLLAAHANLDDTRIILNQLTHGLPSQTPQPCEIANAVVSLESGGVGKRHGSLINPGEPGGADSKILTGPGPQAIRPVDRRSRPHAPVSARWVPVTCRSRDRVKRLVRRQTTG
jgi:hypothetical protein